jgi:uncharacterized OsmC-like protein
MIISASIINSGQQNEIALKTDNVVKVLSIPAKLDGKGSSLNGGELLFLALATCACNDIYREAQKRTIAIKQVEVEVSGEFGREGEPGFNLQYKVKIDSDANTEAIQELINYTDKIAEVHNTLRVGTPVVLKGNS